MNCVFRNKFASFGSSKLKRLRSQRPKLIYVGGRFGSSTNACRHDVPFAKHVAIFGLTINDEF